MMVQTGDVFSAPPDPSDSDKPLVELPKPGGNNISILRTDDFEVGPCMYTLIGSGFGSEANGPLQVRIGAAKCTVIKRRNDRLMFQLSDGDSRVLDKETLPDEEYGTEEYRKYSTDVKLWFG